MTTKTKQAATIGGRIQQARNRAGLSKAEAARRAGIGWDSLHKIERDEREPTAKTLAAICISLGCSADQVLGLSPSG